MFRIMAAMCAALMLVGEAPRLPQVYHNLTLLNCRIRQNLFVPPAETSANLPFPYMPRGDNDIPAWRVRSQPLGSLTHITKQPVYSAPRGR